MTYRNLILSVMLLAVFSALGAGLNVYANVRGAVALEGADLRSGVAVAFDSIGDFDRIGNGGPRVSGRLLQDLDDSGDLRAVRTLGRPAPLPIHEGRQISDGEERVALIGDQVATRSENGQQYIDYDGRAFLVVGRLGVRPASGLAHDVLLQDRGLVDVDGPVVVDIKGGINDPESLGLKGAESLAGRADQRTNIDFVSPILIFCGWGLTLVGASASGLLIADFSRPVAAIRYRLGLRRARVLALSVRPMALCGGALSVTVWAVALMLAGALGSAPELALSAAVPPVLCILTAMGALRAFLWGSER